GHLAQNNQRGDFCTEKMSLQKIKLGRDASQKTHDNETVGHLGKIAAMPAAALEKKDTEELGQKTAGKTGSQKNKENAVGLLAVGEKLQELIGRKFTKIVA